MPEHGTKPPAQGPSARACFVIALVLYVCGAIVFFYLADLEQTGGSASMNGVVVLLYNLGGKWLVAAVAFAMATGFLVAGVVRSSKSRK